VNQTEANVGHRGDRTLDRTRTLFDRMRPVSVQRLRVSQFFDRTRWHVRSLRELLDSNQTLVLWRPVNSAACPVTDLLEHCSGLTSASGLLRDQRVRSSFARSVRTTSASGRCFASVGAVRSARPVNSTSASGQRVYNCFKCLTAIFEGVRL
jgi:hypothetical protein